MKPIDTIDTRTDQHRLRVRQHDLFDTGWYCVNIGKMPIKVRISENYEPLPPHGITTPFNLTEFDEPHHMDEIVQCPVVVPTDDEQNKRQ